MWSYDKDVRRSASGTRWRFVRHDIFDPALSSEDETYEIYFRDESGTACGCLRFDRRKDNPFRDYATMIRKIMNDPDFRAPLLDPGTRRVWRRAWLK